MNKRRQIEAFVNKQVPFRFYGRSLQFYLSQSLFSSFDIDDGSRRLLNSIAQRLNLDQIDTALDIGCGVGVLGICLQKYRPEMAVTVQDRDALALAFTQANAALNGVKSPRIQTGLGLQNLGNQRFDLIVSNLPGKAGQPVLRDMVTRMPAFLTDSGTAALVIVKPLATWLEKTLQDNGSHIHTVGRWANHTVFHFNQGQKKLKSHHSLHAYIRTTHRFQAPGTTYELDTVYNIHEFDTLGYHTRLAMKLLAATRIPEQVLFWNSGQGHWPAAVSQITKGKAVHYTIAGRDYLSLEITRHNLMKQGITSEQITTVHVPSIQDVDGRFELIVMTPDTDPGVPWARILPGVCFSLLAPTGQLLLTAKSGFVGHFLAENRKLQLKQSKKNRGYRSVLLEK